MWADAEAMTRDYLRGRAELAGHVVSTTVPKRRPATLIRLMSSGSERRTVVHRDTRITVECWHDGGEAAASRLAEDVYAALDAWALVPDFDGWPSGPYPQPDPVTGAARYVMTCIVRHRMET